MKLRDMPNIPTRIVAQILGKSEQWVRIGLQRNLLPFGLAVQITEGYSYHISYEKLKEYVGEERLLNYEKKHMENN